MLRQTGVRQVFEVEKPRAASTYSCTNAAGSDQLFSRKRRDGSTMIRPSLLRLMPYRGRVLRAGPLSILPSREKRLPCLGHLMAFVSATRSKALWVQVAETA